MIKTKTTHRSTTPGATCFGFKRKTIVSNKRYQKKKNPNKYEINIKCISHVGTIKYVETGGKEGFRDDRYFSN